MSLQDRLYEDMKKAMKAREAGKLRLSVIRMSRAALKNRAIELGHDLSDDEAIEVLAKEVKMRRDAALEYQRAGRQERMAQLESEIKILKEYLPRQLSNNEITQLVREVIDSVGANNERDLGKVMGVLMPKVKGRADGRLVNQIVRDLLKSGSE
ncbi:MAG TPA: GatB/YqeY domain-containing protein [Syntrophomonadaceae bacterium]|nr:GatB/YqeY domain-containing protein [Syntrophomonadaceae bacterium]